MSSGKRSGSVWPAWLTDTFIGAWSLVWIIGTVWVQPPFSPAGSRPAALNCSIRYGIVLASPGVPGARPWNSSDASTRVTSDMRCMLTCGAAAGWPVADAAVNRQGINMAASSAIGFIAIVLLSLACKRRRSRVVRLKASGKRKGCDSLIMRAVAGEAAFEQGEGVHLERIGNDAAFALEEIRDLARPPPFPARERDMRVEGAMLGLQADLLARSLGLGRERGERFLRLYARP